MGAGRMHSMPKLSFAPRGRDAPSPCALARRVSPAHKCDKACAAIRRFAGYPRPSFFLSSFVVHSSAPYDSPMTVALQATTPATFEIKSANLPLVALLLKSTDLVALARELEARFGDIPDFFDQDALMIDLASLPQGAGEVDFPALISLLGSYQLVPIAVKGGSPAQTAAALQAGLLPVPDAHLVAPRPTVAAPPAPTPSAAPAV